MSARTKRPAIAPVHPRTKRAVGMVLLTAALCAPLLALGQRRAAERARDAAVADYAVIGAQARRLLTLGTPAPGGDGATGVFGAKARTELVARLRASQTRGGPGQVLDLFDLDLAFEAVAPAAPGSPSPGASSSSSAAAQSSNPPSPEAPS